jgi:hypothetical protein
LDTCGIALGVAFEFADVRPRWNVARRGEIGEFKVGHVRASHSVWRLNSPMSRARLNSPISPAPGV